MIFKERTTNIITLSSRRGKGEVFTKLGRIPGAQMIYVSALACTRHRNVDFISLQRQGRLSFLMFDEVDMVTGDYIDKTKQAAAEIAAERKLDIFVFNFQEGQLYARIPAPSAPQEPLRPDISHSSEPDAAAFSRLASAAALVSAAFASFSAYSSSISCGVRTAVGSSKIRISLSR